MVDNNLAHHFQNKRDRIFFTYQTIECVTVQRGILGAALGCVTNWRCSAREGTATRMRSRNGNLEKGISFRSRLRVAILPIEL